MYWMFNLALEWYSYITTSEAIHNAIGGNFPVGQVLMVEQSTDAFKAFVYNIILNRTNVCEEENCVKRSQGPGGIVYFPYVFHHLTDLQFRHVCAALTNAFITENTPLAQWSTGLNQYLLSIEHQIGRCAYPCRVCED